jgi:hypothetical protein
MSAKAKHKAQKNRGSKAKVKTIGAIYDGEKFVLDEPLDLPPNTRIRVRIDRKWRRTNVSTAHQPQRELGETAGAETPHTEDLTPRKAFSAQEIEAIARRMVRDHFETEEFLDRIIWFKSAGNEEEIHLIEVNRDADPSGTVMTLYFGETKKFPLPALVADVTPEEWEQIRIGKIPLPQG